MITIPEFIKSNIRFSRCLEFARQAHGDQIRKYTHEPYIVHPIEVAETIWLITGNCGYDIYRQEVMVQAALLHDTVEDTDVTYNQIENEFGTHVRDLVFWCTDVTNETHGNRKVRKELEAIRIGHAPDDAKTIKIADLMSNTSSITAHDPGFAKVYIREKADLIRSIINNSNYNVQENSALYVLIGLAEQSMNMGS